MRGTQEDIEIIPTIAIYPIYLEWGNTSIWGIYTQIKCSGAIFPEVAASEIPNRRGANIFQHIWIDHYRSRVEFEKFGVQPVVCRVPPYLGVKTFVFEWY